MDEWRKKKVMAELGLNEAAFIRLLSCFIPEVAQELSRFDAAITAADFGEIAHIAHGLKGMMGTLCLTEELEMASEVERLARNQADPGVIREKAAALSEAIARQTG